MSINFVKPVITINGTGNENKTFKFYEKGFEINGKIQEPTWQDVTIAGQMSLTLLNAKADSLNYLKAFGKCEQRRLPVGYTELEYIESTGTQYIDTEYTPTSDIVEYGVEIYGTPNPGSSLFGAESISGSPKYTGVPYTSTFATSVFIGDIVALAPVSITENQWNKYVLQTTSSTAGSVILNGVGADFAYNGGILKTITMYLFANHKDSDVIQLSSIRVKSFYIKDNGVLVRNFIPAKRNYDNELGMYDTATNAFFTNRGTGDFIAGADATPTPSNPISIWCNNGELKVRHQSGLPLGYALLDYIESTGTQYIDTGVKPNQDTRVEMKAQLFSSSGVRFFAAYAPDSSTPFYGVGFSGSGKWVNQTNTANQVLNTNADTNLHIVYKNKSTLYVDGTRIDSSGFGDFTSNYSMYLLAANAGGSVMFKSAGKIYYTKIWDNNTLVRNMIPAKNSSNDVGLYDTVTDNFFTNIGEGNFTAGSVVNDMEVYVDGTQETIAITGKNLFDKNQTYISGFVNSNTGQLVAADSGSNSQRSFCISCQPNTTYILSGMTASSTWGSFTSNTFGNYATSFSVGNGTITTGANDKYLIGLAYLTGGQYDYRNTLQVELGSTATTYEPYFNGGTANAEMLLKVSGYKDVQSIIDGNVTRNIGIKILNGTESWNYDTTYHRAYMYINPLSIVQSSTRSIPAYCTHFEMLSNGEAIGDITSGQGYIIHSSGSAISSIYFHTDITSADGFKAWLQQQYANGTPVIIVYPLATPTTETVTGQPMTIQEGTNIIQVTQSSINGLELEAQYKAGVGVTITQIENVNLDNSVTVTIS